MSNGSGSQESVATRQPTADSWQPPVSLAYSTVSLTDSIVSLAVSSLYELYELNELSC
jgi:hypothetical protein